MGDYLPHPHVLIPQLPPQDWSHDVPQLPCPHDETLAEISGSLVISPVVSSVSNCADTKNAPNIIKDTTNVPNKIFLFTLSPPLFLFYQTNLV